MLQVPEQRFTCSPWEDHGEAGCPPAAHGGPWWSRSPPAAREGPHTGAGGCLKEAVTPWEAHAGAGSWQDLWPRGERSPHWSRFSGRTCDPVGDPCWNSLCLKDCMPWKGPMLEQFVKNCSLWEGPTLEKFMEQGKSVMSPAPEDDEAAENNV